MRTTWGKSGWPEVPLAGAVSLLLPALPGANPPPHQPHNPLEGSENRLGFGGFCAGRLKWREVMELPAPGPLTRPTSAPWLPGPETLSLALER